MIPPPSHWSRQPTRCLDGGGGEPIITMSRGSDIAADESSLDFESTDLVRAEYVVLIALEEACLRQSGFICDT